MINGTSAGNSTNIFQAQSDRYITQGFIAPNGGPSVFINQSLNPNNPVQHFTTDYYSGNQVCIFLGNTWLSDVTSLQFQYAQNKTPFWGYKSQKYDLVAKGTQLVQGVFSVNYIDASYLNMVVAKLKSMDNTGVSNNANVSSSDITNLSNLLTTTNTIDPITLSYNSDGFTSQVKQLIDPGPLTGPVQPATTLQNNNLLNLPFNQKADILQQYFWGQNTNSPNAPLSVDELPPFNITITYGGYPNTGFGPDEFQSSHTVKVIESVDIINHQQMLAITGEPIQEIYTFIARSVSSPITRSTQQLATPAGTGNSTKLNS